MGEYVGLRIRKYDFLMCKNTFGDLLSIFSKEDLCTKEVIDEDDEKYKKYYFSTTVFKAKMILDSLGFTLEEARRDFQNNKDSELEFIDYCEKDPYACDLEWSYKNFEEKYTFEEWVNAVHKYARILSEDTYDYSEGKYKLLDEEKKKKLSFTEEVVLESIPFGEKYFGMQYDEVNLWNIFRVILDAFDEKEEIVLDYTNLYMGGWCDEFPEDEEYYVQKTIILTEGKFDAKVIRQSMEILYPHMTKIFSFMNFLDYKVQGSTNFLTHYLKAFIGAGIQNRIIALYDNDSAGVAEKMELSNVSIPNNVRVLTLPEIELAENYPTLGPNGEEFMNINGRACSIELFLGKDVLLESGKLIPVQWKGYNDKTRTYQGEVMKKNLIQQNFENKIKEYEMTGTIVETNWIEMDILLKQIFKAFQGIV